MSIGLNKVMIIGNVGREPELRFLPSGKPVATFSLASNRQWNSSDGENHNATEWFNIVAWGNLAEICANHLIKGQQVYIEGRLQTRKWDDKEGIKHSTVEIVANEMIILGDRKDSNHSTSNSGVDDQSEMDEYPF